MTWTNENEYYPAKLGRIVGGRQAVPHSHPWQVLLNNRGQFCGGKTNLFIHQFSPNLFSKYSQHEMDHYCCTLCQWVSISHVEKNDSFDILFQIDQILEVYWLNLVFMIDIVLNLHE